MSRQQCTGRATPPAYSLNQVAELCWWSPWQSYLAPVWIMNNQWLYLQQFLTSFHCISILPCFHLLEYSIAITFVRSCSICNLLFPLVGSHFILLSVISCSRPSSRSDYRSRWQHHKHCLSIIIIIIIINCVESRAPSSFGYGPYCIVLISLLGTCRQVIGKLSNEQAVDCMVALAEWWPKRCQLCRLAWCTKYD